jgi:hypothetical protein
MTIFLLSFAAFDDPMLGLCAAAGLSCVRASFTTAGDFRGDFAAFRTMGAVKVAAAVAAVAPTSAPGESLQA